MSTGIARPLVALVSLIALALPAPAQNPFSREQLLNASSRASNHNRSAERAGASTRSSRTNVFSREQIQAARRSTGVRTTTRQALTSSQGDSVSRSARTGAVRSESRISRPSDATSPAGSSSASEAAASPGNQTAPVVIAGSWGGRVIRVSSRTPATTNTPRPDADRNPAPTAQTGSNNPNGTDRPAATRNPGRAARPEPTSARGPTMENPAPRSEVRTGTNAWDVDTWPRYRVAVYRGYAWPLTRRPARRPGTGFRGGRDANQPRFETPANPYDIQNWYPWFGRSES